MTRNELFTQLNSLCSEMDYNYCINSGGCCFVAAVIAEQLEKYKIPFKVSYCIGPTHYWIKVSDRNINRDTFKSQGTAYWSSQFLFGMYFMGDWNWSYSKRWNLIVKTRIAALFRRYGNNVR